MEQLADQLAERTLMWLVPGVSGVANRDRPVDLGVPLQKAFDGVGLFPSIVMGENQHFQPGDCIGVLLALRLSLGVREAKANTMSNAIDVRWNCQPKLISRLFHRVLFPSPI